MKRKELIDMFEYCKDSLTAGQVARNGLAYCNHENFKRDRLKYTTRDIHLENRRGSYLGKDNGINVYLIIEED